MNPAIIGTEPLRLSGITEAAPALFALCQAPPSMRLIAIPHTVALA